MVIVASIAVLAAIVAVLWVVFDLTRKLLRWAARDAEPAPGVDTARRPRIDRGAVPFGGLPPLGPVGPLGQLAPGADITSTGTDEDQLYGERSLGEGL